MKTRLKLILVLSMGLFSANSFAQCLTDDYGQYPGAIYVPTVCDGTTPNEIALNCWTGEYTMVALLAGNSYTFSSSTSSDYVTISDEAGTVAVAFAAATVDYTPTVTGNYRFYLHNSSACDSDQNDRARIIVCNGTVGCLTGNLYPAATFMPAVCDGATANDIAVDCYAGEYSNVGLIGTTQYAFTSSVPTDYITISDATGTSVLASGFEFVFYAPVVNETVRFYTHTDLSCGAENVERTRGVLCLGSTTGLAGPCALGDVWPSDPFTPACTGTAEEIAADCYAGEYSSVSVSINTSYEFSSSNTNDWITITNADGSTVYDYGLGPIMLTTDATTTSLRFYTHVDSLCGSENLDRSRMVKCGGGLGLIDNSLSSFKLYPNPASNKISIEGVLTYDLIEVISIDGRKLRSIVPSSTTTDLDVSALSKGTYFIRAFSNGQVITKEFVKN